MGEKRNGFEMFENFWAKVWRARCSTFPLNRKRALSRDRSDWGACFVQWGWKRLRAGASKAASTLKIPDCQRAQEKQAEHYKSPEEQPNSIPDNERSDSSENTEQLLFIYSGNSKRRLPQIFRLNTELSAKGRKIPGDSPTRTDGTWQRMDSCCTSETRISILMGTIRKRGVNTLALPFLEACIWILVTLLHQKYLLNCHGDFRSLKFHISLCPRLHFPSRSKFWRLPYGPWSSHQINTVLSADVAGPSIMVMDMTCLIQVNANTNPTVGWPLQGRV